MSQTPQIPQPKALIDFSRQGDVKREPVTKTLSPWKTVVLEKAHDDRDYQSNVQTQLAPEAERARRDAQDRIMDRHRDSFQTNLGGPEEGFQGHLESSREVHHEGQQGPNREVFQPELGPRFDIGGQTRGFQLLKPRFVEIYTLTSSLSVRNQSMKRWTIIRDRVQGGRTFMGERRLCTNHSRRELNRPHLSGGNQHRLKSSGRRSDLWQKPCPMGCQSKA